MEAAVEAAEARVAALETTLSDPAFYATRASEAAAVSAELEAAKDAVSRLYDRWQELDQIGR